MTKVLKKDQRLAPFMLGDTRCMCLTANLDAITPTPKKVLIIPGTKPYFIGNSKIGRDIVSYFHLPTYLGLNSSAAEEQDEEPTTFIIRDPVFSSVYGLQTDRILNFVPLSEVEDASSRDLKIPAKLTPYCAGVVKAQGHLWALINLENIICDEHFRAVELPVRQQ